jgi:hypothetical protein
MGATEIDHAFGLLKFMALSQGAGKICDKTAIESGWDCLFDMSNFWHMQPVAGLVLISALITPTL